MQARLEETIEHNSWRKTPYTHLLSDLGHAYGSFLSTRTTVNRHPIHRWYNFVPGFSPEFVEICCRDSQVDEKGIVLDPFSGCGTTQVACNLLGQSSIGFEAHPFLFKINEAKTRSLSIPISRVFQIRKRMFELADGENTIHLSQDAGEFLRKIIPPDELPALLRASQIEKEVSEDEKLLCTVALSKVLELVSSSKTDGIYKAPASPKKSVPFSRAMTAVFKEIVDDLTLVQQRNVANRSVTYFQSSESMSQISDDSVDLVITSPPYLNNFDYAEMTRMQLYFWRYASNWMEITERVRQKLIINTTTAVSSAKDRQKEFRSHLPSNLSEKLDPLVLKLQRLRPEKAGRKEYFLLVYPYFAQISSVIKELSRVMKKGKLFHMIVADSALYGVHIRTERLLAEIMEVCGFDILDIRLLRKRGTRWILKKREGSPDGLGDYHIIAKKKGR
jgi:DNA modification methylase